jgi:hypothetical protein
MMIRKTVFDELLSPHEATIVGILIGKLSQSDLGADQIADEVPPILRGEGSALTSRACAALADEMIHTLPAGPELTVGLRKLLEAKDCFVRAAIKDA